MKTLIACIILLSFFQLTEVNAEIRFEDVTEIVGINYSGSSWGASWGDFNGDGLPDVWTGNHGKIPNLFENNGNGTFTDVSSKILFNSTKGHDPHGASWADFDNDGDQDLIVLTGAMRGLGERSNLLLINDKGLLHDKAEEFGLDYPLGRGRTPLWFDYDNDGLLDILLNNFLRPDGKSSTALFHQEKSNFQNVILSSGIKFTSTVESYSSQISDLSLDGKNDLILLTPSPEGVYEISEFPFTNIRESLSLPNLWTTDLVIADFNGDLFPDLFFSRMKGGNTTSGQESENFLEDKLLINSKNGFQDLTSSSGINNPTSCRSVVSGDFDNDMDVDIYQVCTLLNKNLPNILYENLGNGTFRKVLDAGGAEGSLLGIGDSVTTVDYDEDGFLDLFLTNGLGPRPYSDNGISQLLRNIGNDNHWIEIDLIGNVSNHDGIGARVLVKVGEITQLREQTGGMHYRSQNHQRLHVGLGENSIIDNIVIFWPSGIVHELKNLSSNQILEIIEPTSPIPPKHQMALGVPLGNIMCKANFNLILKVGSESVACVKTSTYFHLIERGWGNAFN